MGAYQEVKWLMSHKPAYSIEFRPFALKQYNKLPSIVKTRISHIIEGLKINPRPRGAIKMTDVDENTYRIHAGDYRVIYSIDDDVLLILVLKVGHRKDVYR
jgi:mRNA interferase RelE/StbE